MESFADVKYCIYADIGWLERVGGSEKVQNYADVIYEWSLIKGPRFIKFWNFFHGLEIFSSLMGFCYITLHIFSCPTFIQDPTFILFDKFSKPYVYSLPYVYSRL